MSRVVATAPPRTTTVPRVAPATAQPLVSARIVRVATQVCCLLALLAIPVSAMPAGAALVEVQLLAAASVYLVARTSRTPGAALLATLRVWGIGAVASVLTFWTVSGGLELGHHAAQVAAVVLMFGLVALGRWREAYREAGSQLDAILATIPSRDDTARAALS